MCVYIIFKLSYYKGYICKTICTCLLYKYYTILVMKEPIYLSVFAYGEF